MIITTPLYDAIEKTTGSFAIDWLYFAICLRAISSIHLI